jgi:hypothetical protein
MPENVESRIDKLKERLSRFVKEGNSKLSLKIPGRIVQGFKLEIVAIAIQDLLRDKYNVSLQYTGYEQNGDDYIYNYKEL